MVMHSRPMISVVMPMHNASPWLPALVAALVKEWSSNFELIAIDDGSSDGSGQLLERLCEHWPQQRWHLLHGGGKGVSAARNLGIQATRAPLVAFLDADDRPLPGRLSLPIQVLNKYPHLSHVHGGWWRCDAKGEKNHAVHPWREGAGFSWRQCLEHKAVLPSAWTVRRQTLLAVGGFDEGLRHSEDVDLLVRLAAAGFKGSWIPQELVRYRIHSGNASAKLKPQLLGLLEVVNRHLNNVPGSYKAWARELRYGTTTWAVWQAWQANQQHFALQLLRLALRDCPYPLVRRPVQLIEAFQRSNNRIGRHFHRNQFLNSEFWGQAESMLLAR